MSKIFEFQDVTRIAVVTDDGMVFEQYDLYDNGVELHLQDNGRTLKLFPVQREAPAAPRQSVPRAVCGSIYSHERHVFYRNGTPFGCDGVVR